ncbi:MAG: helix-turn-helix domain-containing protein [Maribacter stanieri]
MTTLGEYFLKKSLNKANISRRTGIKATRLTHLSRKESTKLTAEELHLISLAIEVEPIELLSELYGHLKLKS